MGLQYLPKLIPYFNLSLFPPEEWGSQYSLNSLASEEELDKERLERESLLDQEPQLLQIEGGVAMAPIDQGAKASTPSSQVQVRVSILKCCTLICLILQECDPQNSASITEYDTTIDVS